MASSHDSTGDVITGDLPCASCGYNLRTLAVSGRCPECGEPVATSFTSQGFRFRNPMTPSRVRNGIAVIIVAVLLATVVNLVYMGAIYLVWVVTGRLPSILLRIAVPATAHALVAIPVLTLIGAVLMTWPFGRRGDRFLWPVGVGVAVLGAGYVLYAFIVRVVPWGSGGPSTYWAGVRMLIGQPALLTAFALALTLACIHLLTRVRFRWNRALWLAVLCVVLVQTVTVTCAGSLMASWIHRAKYMTVSTGTIRIQPPGPVLKTVSLPSLLGVSRHRIEGIVSLITIGVLWLYLRRLRQWAGSGVGLGALSRGGGGAEAPVRVADAPRSRPHTSDN